MGTSQTPSNNVRIGNLPFIVMLGAGIAVIGLSKLRVL